MTRPAEITALRIAVHHHIRASLSEGFGGRTASEQLQYQRVATTLVTAGLFDWMKRIPSRSRQWLDDQKLKLWKKVDRRLEKVRGLFKEPRAVQALSELVKGNLTPQGIKKLLAQGKDAAKKLFGALRPFLTRPSDLPTLTDLIKRTTIGAGIADWFNANVRPRTEQWDAVLAKYVPTLGRVLKGALFAWIWLNVDELSWDLASIIAGFLGNISLGDLLASLPESIIGLLSSQLFGIGYTVMPAMIGLRLFWLLSNQYLEWSGDSWKPNWRKVDKEAFENAST